MSFCPVVFYILPNADEYDKSILSKKYKTSTNTNSTNTNTNVIITDIPLTTCAKSNGFFRIMQSLFISPDPRQSFWKPWYNANSEDVDCEPYHLFLPLHIMIESGRICIKDITSGPFYVQMNKTTKYHKKIFVWAFSDILQVAYMKKGYNRKQSDELAAKELDMKKMDIENGQKLRKAYPNILFSTYDSCTPSFFCRWHSYKGKGLLSVCDISDSGYKSPQNILLQSQCIPECEKTIIWLNKQKPIIHIHIWTLACVGGKPPIILVAKVTYHTVST